QALADRVARLELRVGLDRLVEDAQVIERGPGRVEHGAGENGIGDGKYRRYPAYCDLVDVAGGPAPSGHGLRRAQSLADLLVSPRERRAACFLGLRVRDLRFPAVRSFARRGRRRAIHGHRTEPIAIVPTTVVKPTVPLPISRPRKQLAIEATEGDKPNTLIREHPLESPERGRANPVDRAEQAPAWLVQAP